MRRSAGLLYLLGAGAEAATDSTSATRHPAGTSPATAGSGSASSRRRWLGASSSPSTRACPGSPASAARRRTSSFGWTEPAIVIVNVCALVIALVGVAVSVRNIRKTHEAEASEGESRGVLGAGEGRKRYMAVWGIWTSVLFFFAIAFNSIAVFWEGLCLD